MAFRKLDGMGGTLPTFVVAHVPISHDCDEVMFFYQWLGFRRSENRTIGNHQTCFLFSSFFPFFFFKQSETTQQQMTSS